MAGLSTSAGNSFSKRGDSQALADDLREICVPAAIALRAAEHPRAPAVGAGGKELTYAALERAATRLAGRLRELHAGPDTIVALCTDRSTALAAGALGILEAGAAYLPLDPSY